MRSRLDGKMYAAKIVRIGLGSDEDEAHEHLYRALSEVRIHSQLCHVHILKYHASWVELEAFTEEEREQL